MRDKGWKYSEPFELEAGQPLLSMRLLAEVSVCAHMGIPMIYDMPGFYPSSVPPVAMAASALFRCRSFLIFLAIWVAVAVFPLAASVLLQ